MPTYPDPLICAMPLFIAAIVLAVQLAFDITDRRKATRKRRLPK